MLSYVLYEFGMMTEPKSITDLISKWKRIGKFAADVGCGYEAARQMRMRNSISPKHWTNVVNASAAKGIEGVTFEWLSRQHASAENAA